MKISTKYNLKDAVWFMKNNVCVNAVIASIKTFNVGTNQDNVVYSAYDFKSPVSWQDHVNLHENMLFESKQDLLFSLSSDLIYCKGKNCNAINGKKHSIDCIKEHSDCFV